MTRKLLKSDLIKLNDAGGDIKGRWYFEFSINGERQRKTFNINRLKSKALRYQFAEKFIKEIATIYPDLIQNNKVSEIALTKKMYDLLLKNTHSTNKRKKAKLSLRTTDTYRLYINRFDKFLESIDHRTLLLSDFNVDLAQGFQNFLLENLELANKSTNCTIQLISSYIKALHPNKSINFFQDVTTLPEKRSAKYIPFTEEEKVAIACQAKRDNPSAYLFYQFEYTTFLRPVEICGVRRNQLDFKRRLIIVNPEHHKNNKAGYRQMLRPLYDLLIEMGVDRYPMNAIVFEDFCGNNNNLALRRKKVTEYWHDTVIIGLGINNHLYALKHTGNIDYILQNPNYDLIWLQRQNGHSSIAMTERYIRDLGIYLLKDENIISKPFGEITF